MENLNEKAVDIKGKKYVLVSDRVLYFNEAYPLGSIETELLSKPEDTRVVVKATVKVPVWRRGEEPTPTEDPHLFLGLSPYPNYRYFTGHSQAVIGEGMVNKTAALENAETSAVGRALGMMGIGVIESIASADEMRKATSPVQMNSAPDLDDTP